MTQNNRIPNAVCNICKKPVYRRPSSISRNNGVVYCSQTCYGVSNRIERPCLYCGNLLLAGDHKKTCNRICANKLRSGTGYKKGRPPKDAVKAAASVRLRVVSAYGGQCARCGYDKYPITHVHHKNRNRQDNSIANLELLCPNCHAETHFIEKLEKSHSG